MRFLVKETYETVKIMNNHFKIWIIFLHNDGKIIILIFGLDRRYFYIIFIAILIAIEPTEEKSVTSSLSVVTCFTLIQKNILVGMKKLFYNAKNSLTNLPIVWRM